MNFHITLSPVRADPPLTLSKSGTILTIDSTDYDFGLLDDGDTLPHDGIECGRLVSDVIRSGDTVSLTLMFPHGGNAPEEARFPQALAMTRDGPVTLPPWETEPKAEKEDGA